MAETNNPKSSTSGAKGLRHPNVPVAGENLPWRYQTHRNPSLYKYKLICLGKDRIVYDDDDDPNPEYGTSLSRKSKNTPHTPQPSKEPSQSRPITYKDFDNPHTTPPDTTLRTYPKHTYKPTFRYYLTSTEDFDYETMLAVFSVCRSLDGGRHTHPITELMPDALFAIQTIKESLNADERRNGTHREWEISSLFYFVVAGDISCLFLEQREATGLKGLEELRECILEDAETEEEKVIARKATGLRRLLGLPPKKPRRPPTEEDIRKMEEMIMAIRLI